MTAQAAISKMNVSHQDMANAIRALAMDAVEAAQSGHPGMPMGMADVATVLFTQFLKYDPAHPAWPDRDRFILSAGHGSMLLYAMLYLTGYGDITLEDIKNFRQWGAKTAGHPEFGHAAGIETTTGPLGQGLANAVGMAIAEAHLAARFGKELVDHHTYVIAGDGCLMEGISQESISLAGHLKLNKLIVLFDDNGISIDGPTNLSITEDTLKRFDASGWKTMRVNGHDPFAVTTALSQAKASDRPTLIACKTTIAYGAPTKAGSEKSHGSPLGAGEIDGARKNLNWPHKAFEIPKEVLHAWRDIGHLHDKDYAVWKKRFDKYEQEHQDEFTHALSGDLPKGWGKAVAELKAKIAAEKPSKATRNASQDALDVLCPVVTELLGGSADLTGSNNTKAKGLEPLTAQNYAGRYLYYGIREHGMAAAMNGMALHGGVIPYGGTFLVFTDYCRPAIRLSALMKQRVIYVMTHDSIGLGEDGPTHQPVEHLASLRAIPNLLVFRPADAMETAECWELAVSTPDAPSILALSRQALPTLRQEATKDNLCAKGGYLLIENKKAKVTLIATGSEVSLAVDAAKALEAKGIPASVVSLPCWELFDAQTPEYRAKVLGKDTLKIAIEAASGFGWERYIGQNGIFIGMEGFGASAPAKELYKQFGITAERVVDEAMKKLGVLL